MNCMQLKVSCDSPLLSLFLDPMLHSRNFHVCINYANY